MDIPSIPSEESIPGSSLFVYVDADIGQYFPTQSQIIPYDSLMGTRFFNPLEIIAATPPQVDLAYKTTGPMGWYDGFKYIETGGSGGGTQEPAQYWSD